MRRRCGGERSRRTNRSPRSELPSCGRPTAPSSANTRTRFGGAFLCVQTLRICLLDGCCNGGDHPSDHDARFGCAERATDLPSSTCPCVLRRSPSYFAADPGRPPGVLSLAERLLPLSPWVGFAVAVGLRVAFPQLLFWRFPLSAARHPPCGTGWSALGGF